MKKNQRVAGNRCKQKTSIFNLRNKKILIFSREINFSMFLHTFKFLQLLRRICPHSPRDVKNHLRKESSITTVEIESSRFKMRPYGLNYLQYFTGHSYARSLYVSQFCIYPNFPRTRKNQIAESSIKRPRMHGVDRRRG